MPSQDTPTRRLTLTFTSSLNLGSSLEVGSITVRSSFSSVETKDRRVSVGGGSWLPLHGWGDREQRHPQGLLTEQPCSQAHGRGGRAYLPGSHGAPTLVFWEKRWGAGGALIQIQRKVTINKPEEELSFTKKACYYVRAKPCNTRDRPPLKNCVFSRSVVSGSFVTPQTVAHQAPLPKGFPRQENWSGLPFPSPGDLPNPGDRTRISSIGRWILYH